MQSSNLYITDITGGKWFKTNTSVGYELPEVNNLRRHLDEAKINPSKYPFDVKTAYLVVNGQDWDKAKMDENKLLQCLIVGGF